MIARRPPNLGAPITDPRRRPRQNFDCSLLCALMDYRGDRKAGVGILYTPLSLIAAEILIIQLKANPIPSRWTCWWP
jgi:hypothetical protein